MDALTIPLLIAAVLIGLGGLGLGVVITWRMKRLRTDAQSRILRSLSDAPAQARIVVLGCPPQGPSGRPNRYFVGRVAAAAAAYHHTPTRRVLCSGGVDAFGRDEAIALAEALETASVPRSAIDLDRDAARTIDSIEHVARTHMGEPILVVTQAFHMPRSLHLARHHGIDAWGLVADGPRPGLRVRLREGLAEQRASLDLLWRRRTRRGRT
jgi:SanA protein